MPKYFRITINLFPLLLVGIFFIATNVWAQTANVSATVQVHVTVCGDLTAEPPTEECDGYDLNGASCSSEGFDAGTLACDVSCSFDTSGCYDEEDDDPIIPGGGGGGGGGGAPDPPDTGVNFFGRAYPMSSVTILKDGQVAATTIAGPDANFQVSLTDLSAGNYNFAVYSEDGEDRRSSLFTFSVYISRGATTNISGIFIAPTISIDKSEVRHGDNIAIFGQSVPDATVTINVNSEPEFFRHINTDEDGIYLYNFDTSVLTRGDHSARSKTKYEEEISNYGQSLAFVVGDDNVVYEGDETACGSGGADVNCDSSVNLIDFSIAAYWYKRGAPPANVDINNDGKVDLIDFSIMAFHWTG